MHENEIRKKQVLLKCPDTYKGIRYSLNLLVTIREISEIASTDISQYTWQLK